MSNEVDSSISLALQLIKISGGNTQSNQNDWVYCLSSLEQTRHLTIQLKKPSGSIIDITQSAHINTPQERPPGWFVNLVVSDYPKVEYQMNTFDNQSLTLIIQANPLDEITEVWHETLAFLGSILLLVLLTFLSVQLVFNKTLKAI